LIPWTVELLGLARLHWAWAWAWAWAWVGVGAGLLAVLLAAGCSC
jgi:hypothetical protein